MEQHTSPVFIGTKGSERQCPVFVSLLHILFIEDSKTRCGFNCEGEPSCLPAPLPSCPPALLPDGPSDLLGASLVGTIGCVLIWHGWHDDRPPSFTLQKQTGSRFTLVHHAGQKCKELCAITNTIIISCFIFQEEPLFKSNGALSKKKTCMILVIPAAN